MKIPVISTPEHIQDLLRAEEEGRLLVLDEELVLALAAVVHGCNTNRRLVGASYIWDIRAENGGPKQMSYFRAIELLLDVVDSALYSAKKEES